MDIALDTDHATTTICRTKEDEVGQTPLVKVSRTWLAPLSDAVEVLSLLEALEVCISDHTPVVRWIMDEARSLCPRNVWKGTGDGLIGCKEVAITKGGVQGKEAQIDLAPELLLGNTLRRHDPSCIG